MRGGSLSSLTRVGGGCGEAPPAAAAAAAVCCALGGITQSGLVCSLQSNPTLLQDCALKARPGSGVGAGWSPAAPAKSERLHCQDGEAGRENERGGGKGKSIKSLGRFAQA